MIYGMHFLKAQMLLASLASAAGNAGGIQLTKNMISEMTFVRWLGTGQLGSVAAVRHRTGDYALKFEKLRYFGENVGTPEHFENFSDRSKVQYKQLQTTVEQTETLTRSHPSCARSYGTLRLDHHTIDDYGKQFIDKSLETPETAQLFEEGSHYIVSLMELGQEDLKSWLAKPEHKNPNDKLKALYDVCLAVSNIHKIGLCHFDLKPDNVLVTKDSNRVALMDFGNQILGKLYWVKYDAKGKQKGYRFQNAFTLAEARAKDVSKIIGVSAAKTLNCLLPSDIAEYLKKRIRELRQRIISDQIGEEFDMKIHLPEHQQLYYGWQRYGYPSAENLCQAIKQLYENRDMSKEQFWDLIDPTTNAAPAEKLQPDEPYDVTANSCFAQDMMYYDGIKLQNTWSLICSNVTRVTSCGKTATNTRTIYLDEPKGMLIVWKNGYMGSGCKSVINILGINGVYRENIMRGRQRKWIVTVVPTISRKCNSGGTIEELQIQFDDEESAVNFQTTVVDCRQKMFTHQIQPDTVQITDAINTWFDMEESDDDSGDEKRDDCVAVPQVARKRRIAFVPKPLSVKNIVEGASVAASNAPAAKAIRVKKGTVANLLRRFKETTASSRVPTPKATRKSRKKVAGIRAIFEKLEGKKGSSASA